MSYNTKTNAKNQLGHSEFNFLRSVLLRINVWEGQEQYERSTQEIYRLINDGLKSQAKRREDHAQSLMQRMKGKAKE